MITHVSSVVARAVCCSTPSGLARRISTVPMPNLNASVPHSTNISHEVRALSRFVLDPAPVVSTIDYDAPTKELAERRNALVKAFENRIPKRIRLNGLDLHDPVPGIEKLVSPVYQTLERVKMDYREGRKDPQLLGYILSPDSTRILSWGGSLMEVLLQKKLGNEVDYAPIMEVYSLTRKTVEKWHGLPLKLGATFQLRQIELIPPLQVALELLTSEEFRGNHKFLQAIVKDLSEKSDHMSKDNTRTFRSVVKNYPHTDSHFCALGVVQLESNKASASNLVLRQADKSSPYTVVSAIDRCMGKWPVFERYTVHDAVTVFQGSNELRDYEEAMALIRSHLESPVSIKDVKDQLSSRTEPLKFEETPRRTILSIALGYESK